MGLRETLQLPFPPGRLAPTTRPEAPGRHMTGSAHRLSLRPAFIHSPSHRSLLSTYCIQGAVPGSVTSTLTPCRVFSIKPPPPRSAPCGRDAHQAFRLGLAGMSRGPSPPRTMGAATGR